MKKAIKLILLLIIGLFPLLVDEAIAQDTFTQPDFFRTVRQLPLVNLNTTQDIFISSYSANPNDGIDDIQGISNAVNAAKAISGASNPVRLVFEKGTYDLFAQTGQSHSISISNAKYLVLDGNGSEIMLHNPEVGFLSLYKCENVIVQDLFIDYAKLPFTQGKVIATNASNNTLDLQIDEGFPLLSEEYFTRAGQKWGMLKEETGQLKKGVTNLFPYRGWTHVSGNVFRINQPNASYIDQIDVGDYFVQIARNNGKTIFKSNNGKNITFLNNTSYASPAGTYNAFNHYEWNIINCKIRPKAGRVQSANADCIHISGSNIGPWVEGCRFEAYSDDAVNMKYTSRRILSVQSPTMVTLKGEVSKSDTICFFNPLEGKLLGRVGITAVSNIGSNNYQIALSEAVDITTISDHQSSDKAYIDTRSCESFVFRNDTMRNGRRYGMLLQNSYGVIENCLFENLSSCGIMIENGADWGEGFTANNIKIANNKFVNCGFDTSFINEEIAASISTRITMLGSPCDETKTWCGVETADWKGLKNIEISGNYFEYNKAALNLNNIDNGEISGSQFIHNTNDITLQPGEEVKSISINNCDNMVNLENDEPTSSVVKKKDKSGYTFTIEDKHLKITFNNDSFLPGDILVYDCMGRKVRTIKMNNSLTMVNLSGFKAGMYVLRTQSKTGYFVDKFILN